MACSPTDEDFEAESLRCCSWTVEKDLSDYDSPLSTNPLNLCGKSSVKHLVPIIVKRIWPLILPLASIFLPVMFLGQKGNGLGPMETLRDRDRRIREVLREDKSIRGSERESRLRVLVTEIFDYETHARESLGQYWSQLAEGERKEALQLIATLLERSSIEKVQEYQTDRIQYLSETNDSSIPAAVCVTTRVTREGEAWEIAYRMRQVEGRWKIVDVLVEGASTVESNRASFYKEIRSSGIQSLLAKLRKKAALK